MESDFKAFKVLYVTYVIAGTVYVIAGTVSYMQSLTSYFHYDSGAVKNF